MSKNGIAGIVFAVEAILKLFGIEFPEGTAASFAEALALVVGVILMAIHQFQRRDLTAGLIRKN